MEQLIQTNQVITRVDDLSSGGQLFIWSMREWARAALMKECVCRELYQAYAVAGCGDAVALLDEFMSLLAVAASRPVDVRCPCATELSDDERLILKLLTQLQRRPDQDGLALIHKLIGGSIASAFCRAASLYGKYLGDAGLPLATPPKLSLVPKSNCL